MDTASGPTDCVGRLRKLARTERTVSVTLCAPGVPLVFARAWAWREGPGLLHSEHELYKVVAVRSSVVREYVRDRPAVDGAAFVPGTEGELWAAGWTLDVERVEDTCLVVDDEHGLIPWDDPLFDLSNTARVLVAWPYPAWEEESPWVELIAQLRDEAETNLLTHEGR